MINHAEVKGILGKDPEIAVTKTGKEVAHFSIAIKLRNKDYPLWYNVEAWNYVATKVKENLHKGSAVIVTGSLSLNRYSTADGQTREIHQIIADDVELVEKTTVSTSSSGPQAPTPTFVPKVYPDALSSTSLAPSLDIDTDDLPF